MLEELCRSAMYNACHEITDNQRLVRLKNQPKEKKWPLQNFFGTSYLSFDWHCIPLAKVARKRANSIECKAWRWFNKNADKLCRAFIENEYYGDLMSAMLLSGSFESLFDEFKTYFAERRKAFMDKTTQLLQLKTAELSARGKVPQSHGGVANLLKELTKTMKGQGSSVYTIAKVQYAICMQAGIYIPDEFLTDVLTAADIMGADHANHHD